MAQRARRPRRARARASTLACALALGAALSGGAARAQEGDDEPVVAGPEGDEALRAEALFRDGRWAEAAQLLERVASGRTGDTPTSRQIAQHRLGIALHALRFPHASFSIFSAIADAPDHARHDAALLWLLKLAEELPEPAGVAERIGRYGDGALARFARPSDRRLRGELAYWLGRDAYRTGAHADAARRFEAVPPESPRYPEAQLFAGLAHVQMRRPDPALAAFRRLVAPVAPAAPAAPAGGADDDRALRLQDLARLSVGRTLYSTSVRLGPQGAVIDAARLRAALASYAEVTPWAEAWQESLFEQAWVHFMLGDYPVALGHLHAVEAPFFRGSFYPEAGVLRAIVALVLCRWDEAEAHAARVVQQYGPALHRLEVLLAAPEEEGGEARLVELLEAVRAGALLDAARAPDPWRLPDAAAAEPARAAVSSALSGRDLGRHLDHLRAIDREAARLARAPAAFRSSAVGGQIDAALAIARERAMQDAGALVRGRLRRAASELERHLASARRIFAGAARARRASTPRAAPLRAPTGAERAWTDGLLISSDGFEIWPFDGEYWPDEMGHYRQLVTSRCGR